MVLLFVILIILASVILGLIVLIQNPKGGGLAGNIAGFSTQFMGVKQTTDILEKGTWVFAALIAILSLTSTVFFSGSSSGVDKGQNINTNATPQQQPANTTTFPVVPKSDSPAKK